MGASRVDVETKLIATSRFLPVMPCAAEYG